MPKFVIVVIIVVVIGLLVWLFFPRAQVVRLVVCPGAANNEPDIDDYNKEIHVRWNHIFGTKVKFKNQSNFDNVHLRFECEEFFENPPSELDFNLAIGESKTLTVRKGLEDDTTCEYEVNPRCKLPGPVLIKRP